MKDFSPLNFTRPAIGFTARIGVITLTNGTVKRFAESDEPVVVGVDTFSVVPGLSVSGVKHTANGEVPSCEFVGMHGSGAFFDSFELDVGLYDGATVQLYIVDRLDLSRKGLLFTGAISTITYDPCSHDVSFQVKGPSIAARQLMTQTRTPMCRTDLFSGLCGLNKATYAVATTVATIIDGFNFTVSGSLAQADGYFNQGVGVTATNFPFVIGNWVQSTQTITTYLPLRALSVGQALTLYPGCDKTMGPNGCPKFSNQQNFQGEPHFLGTAAAAQQV